MSPRATRRADLLERLNEALRADARLAGAVLVGSGAGGFRDDESDIDMVVPVDSGHDARAVFEDWKQHITGIVGGLYLADTAATDQQHLLVVHCDGLLEVDVSFPALDMLAATAPDWRVVWERSGEVTSRMVAANAERDVPAGVVYTRVLNRTVHRVTAAARALRRGEAWKANLQLDELRRFTLQLACLDLLGNERVDSQADALPPETLKQFDDALPSHGDVRSVATCLRACVRMLLRHAEALDRRYAMDRCATLRPLLMQHVDSTSQQGAHIMSDTEELTRPKWFTRRFGFGQPLWMLTDFTERLRGTPDRLEALLHSLPAAILDQQPDGSWSILQNAGHLADTEVLWLQRVEDLRLSRPIYTAARPEYFQEQAQHHQMSTVAEVLAEFRARRNEYIAVLGAADADLQRREAVHERLGVPMRLVDCAQFVAEHDDHHLLRIRELAAQLAGAV